MALAWWLDFYLEDGFLLAWESSDRASRLPKDWAQRRALVAARADGRCEAQLRDGSRCSAFGTDCDHVVHGDDHSLANLQWLCPWHHKRKTAREAAEDLAAARQRCMDSPRPHPGLVS